jgi:prefoldin subunit 5
MEMSERETFDEKVERINRRLDKLERNLKKLNKDWDEAIGNE